MEPPEIMRKSYAVLFPFWKTCIPLIFEKQCNQVLRLATSIEGFEIRIVQGFCSLWLPSRSDSYPSCAHLNGATAIRNPESDGRMRRRLSALSLEIKNLFTAKADGRRHRQLLEGVIHTKKIATVLPRKRAALWLRVRISQ